jgi:glycosyltransferase involved in cell wall biosynthesis
MINAFDIIMPVHNRDNYILERAIDSIINQTFKYWKLYIVDDYSDPDKLINIEKIVNKYINKLDPNDKSRSIEFIKHETNKGLPAARNTGINSGCNPLIAFLDDDDFFYPNHLELHYKAHDKIGSNYPLVYTDIVHIYEDNGARRHYQCGRFSKEKFLDHNYISVMCATIRRDILDKVGMFDESLMALEDWDLWSRIAKDHEFAYVPHITAAYCFRSGNYSNMCIKNKEEINQYDDFLREKVKKLYEN